MIERIPIASRDQWLTMRRQDVTASVAGSLLGVHEYQTAYNLWALKSGKISEDVEETPAMTRGMLLEPVAMKLLRIDRPDLRLTWNGIPGEISGDYFRDPEHRIGCTPDCFMEDDRGRGIVQFKSVEQNIFRKKWHVGDDDGSYAEISPPLWTVVQAIIEADLTESQTAALAVLVVGSGLQVHFIDVPIHAGVIDRMREAVKDFWRRVEQNDPPTPDYAADGETIAKIYSADNGREIDLSRDNRMVTILEERENLLALRKDAKDRLEPLNAELKEKLGENTAAYARGWQVTNKLQHRKAYAVEANAFRVLRTKRI
jgi:predicted phage-related endonuclease